MKVTAVTYHPLDLLQHPPPFQMPFTPRGDGHINVQTEENGVKKTKRVQDPIPPGPKSKWHRLGEEGRWVYQYDDIESEQN